MQQAKQVVKQTPDFSWSSAGHEDPTQSRHISVNLKRDASSTQASRQHGKWRHSFMQLAMLDFDSECTRSLVEWIVARPMGSYELTELPTPRSFIKP